MKVNIKKFHPSARIPFYANPTDGGLDLTAVEITHDKFYTEYNTGLGIEIPEGFVGLLFPRSSISNTVHYLANAVGVIDSGYRGPIKLRFKTDANIFEAIKQGLIDNDGQARQHIYKMGDKVGQLIIIPYPKIELNEVDELVETDRGTNGFGSSGQ